MKKLIGLITVIFTLSILTPTFAFSEEQSKAKKFWLQTKESVKEAGKDIKQGVKDAGKEIKEGGKDAGKQVGNKAKSEEKKGEAKAKKDVNTQIKDTDAGCSHCVAHHCVEPQQSLGIPHAHAKGSQKAVLDVDSPEYGYCRAKPPADGHDDPIPCPRIEGKKKHKLSDESPGNDTGDQLHKCG